MIGNLDQECQIKAPNALNSTYNLKWKIIDSKVDAFFLESLIAR